MLCWAPVLLLRYVSNADLHPGGHPKDFAIGALNMARLHEHCLIPVSSSQVPLAYETCTTWIVSWLSEQSDGCAVSD